MKVRHLSLCCLFIFGMLIASQETFAHRQPTVWSELNWINLPANSALRMTHRMHYHDALALLGLAGFKDLGLDAPAGQEALVRALADNIDVRSPDRGSLPIMTLGGEVEGNYMFIYQEVETGSLDRLRFKMNFLGGITQDAEHRVNLLVGEDRFSYVFREGSDYALALRE